MHSYCTVRPPELKTVGITSIIVTVFYIKDLIFVLLTVRLTVYQKICHSIKVFCTKNKVDISIFKIDSVGGGKVGHTFYERIRPYGRYLDKKITFS